MGFVSATTAATIATYAAVASAALAAAGTGIAVYGAVEQAGSQRRIASYNHAVQQQQAQLQHAMATRQAQHAQAQSQAQAAIQNRNAAILDQQANLERTRGRETVRRMRDEHLRFQAIQQARIAKSGVVAEGTPLEVLADTAGALELQRQDAAYESEVKAQGYERNAELERFGGRMSLLDGSMGDYEIAAANAGLRINMAEAKINRMAGFSRARATQTGGYASAISGLGDAASGVSNIYKQR
jgi:hypothetical protein